jgi:hypothetical protein
MTHFGNLEYYLSRTQTHNISDLLMPRINLWAYCRPGQVSVPNSWFSASLVPNHVFVHRGYNISDHAQVIRSSE